MKPSELLPFERVFIIGSILLFVAVLSISSTSSVMATQDNSQPGSFGLGATVSVQVDRATTTSPIVIAPVETSLPYIAVGFVAGIIVAFLLMRLRRRKRITASSGLCGGEKHG